MANAGPLNNSASPEIECKLDAPDRKKLDSVTDYIAKHYDVKKITPREKKEPRYYYDVIGLNTPYALAAHHAGMELRVERKADDRWKMTVKTGGNTGTQQGLFRRVEHVAYLDSPTPDLTKLDEDAQRQLRQTFRASNLAKIPLIAVARIKPEIERVSFRPESAPAAVIEHASSAAKAKNCLGFSVKIRQAELEDKEGASERILLAERKRLCDRFNFLTINHHSKPYAVLADLEEKLKNHDIREAVLDQLLKADGEFTICDIPALAL